MESAAPLDWDFGGRLPKGGRRKVRGVNWGETGTGTGNGTGTGSLGTGKWELEPSGDLAAGT